MQGWHWVEYNFSFLTETTTTQITIQVRTLYKQCTYININNNLYLGTCVCLRTGSLTDVEMFHKTKRK